MEDCKVTIVAVARDHFSDTGESLESIYENTAASFRLVYVDGGSRKPVAGYLRRASESRGFRLIRTEHYLTPNQARNLGAKGVDTPYIVFIDNDVIVAPDWFPPLIDCADETGAAIVSPLTFEERPVHTKVHFTGGEVHVETVQRDGRTERHLIDRIYKKKELTTREVTECAEFHCMLVRAEAFRAVGGLDEAMLSTRENLDFCMTVREASGTIYLEPRSRITYLPPVRLRFADVPFFALRWSDDWELTSFHHFRDKWDLTEDAYFEREYRNLGWRRRVFMMHGGVLRWLPSWKLRIFTEWAFRPLEKRVNKLVSRRHARKHGIKIAV